MTLEQRIEELERRMKHLERNEIDIPDPPTFYLRGSRADSADWDEMKGMK